MVIEKFPFGSLGIDVTIVVENPRNWLPDNARKKEFPNIDVIMLTDLNEEYLVCIRPTCIVTPLFGVAHDVTDIGERLSDIGYRGRFRATSPSLPNTPLVRQELSVMFPDLDFDIVIMEPLHS